MPVTKPEGIHHSEPRRHIQYPFIHQAIEVPATIIHDQMTDRAAGFLERFQKYEVAPILVHLIAGSCPSGLLQDVTGTLLNEKQYGDCRKLSND